MNNNGNKDDDDIVICKCIAPVKNVQKNSYNELRIFCKRCGFDIG